MKTRAVVLALPLALASAACSTDPVSPDAAATAEQVALQPNRGTGLVLDNFTEVNVPLLGIPLGEAVIDQAVITNFAVVENAVGAIVGLEAQFDLLLTSDVLGGQVLLEDLTSTVSVTSSGPGQCELITIDLGEVNVGLPGVSVDVPEATLTGRGSGALGSLLCNLGQLLARGASGVQGVVNAINNRI